MFLGCKCIYKHFVETKNNELWFLEHLLYSFLVIKTTEQEFGQNQCHDIIRSSEMNMLLLSAEDKLHKKGFSFKIVLKTDSKRRRILLSQFYYKVGKDKGSIFFQSLCEVAISQFAFLYSLGRKNGNLISCCGNIKKRMMCEAKPRTRLNNLKTCLSFPSLGLNTTIDSIKLTVLLWCINNICMYVI